MALTCFDILVIGGGHAGVEAAHIASQYSNLKIGIITLPTVPLASAPCNPCIGGVGKGQVVRELDALGGIQGKLADLSGIQYRTLNDSKGYAVQSTRVQIDKDLYSEMAEKEISKISNISVIRERVIAINRDDDFLVKTIDSIFQCKKLIITVGTFFNGKIHIGPDEISGGRINAESTELDFSFFDHIKLVSGRFKTGTPARILSKSVDYTKMEEQPSDDQTPNFHWSYRTNTRFQRQVSCHLTRTNIKTMEIIRFNKEKSPMFNGQIKAVGARYCPSIEDKAYRYPDKNIHHVFVEPEGLNSGTLYPSGISSSLPKNVQQDFIETIPGLENCEVETYGYAVEYDVIDTTQLSYQLEHEDVPGLYFAGQVNGTSGYEEAAGQGFIAGVNAALLLCNLNPIVLSRSDSYIGVMVEDLISNTRDEPYRLFTARNENRLFVREDNTFLRMHNYRLKLCLNTELDIYSNNFNKTFNEFYEILGNFYLSPNDNFLDSKTISIPKRSTVSEVLCQPDLNPIKILSEWFEYNNINLDVLIIRSLAISIKYAGYINKANSQNTKIEKLDSSHLDWQTLYSSENISFECKQRIEQIRPKTFGQLKLIEGIRPATLAAVASSLN